jgi:hypothetical protein
MWRSHRFRGNRDASRNSPAHKQVAQNAGMARCRHPDRWFCFLVFNDFNNRIGWLMTLIGAGWAFITRIRIWWHHD